MLNQNPEQVVLTVIAFALPASKHPGVLYFVMSCAFDRRLSNSLLQFTLSKTFVRQRVALRDSHLGLPLEMTLLEIIFNGNFQECRRIVR